MGDIGMLKYSVASVSVSGSTKEEEGGETVNTGQTSITKYNKAKRGARGELTQY